MTNSENTPRSRSKDTSKTAVLVATIRAVHLRWHDPPHIFEDTFAMHMLTPFWHAVAKYRPLRWLVGDVILGVYRPVYPAVVLRSRYTEDQLVEAIESGTEQYVILGAGHDTFALRRKDLADKVRVFEVDHPATQEVKRQRILKANGSIPDNLTFVPVDFEVDRLDEEMEKAGFNSQQPAFYSWLGVTYYLTPEAIRDTLDRVAQKSAPGSRIVFDFKIAKHMMTQEGRTLCEKMEGFVARRGEPMLTD
ncbi:MAG: class I SAM-dependent methyltransferase, partial [Caldilineaceae bacterium]|nr:class I SAM-dependent methyltransferase [Caldilineaceae bacterium]